MAYRSLKGGGKMSKKAERIRKLFNSSNSATRAQWEYVNQKGFDFANDNQLTEEERLSLEEQGMPTFTINRIIPVVEMLNFYATANQPRWQAVATEGSDSDIAALFSDVADYIWYISDGSTLYANAINDAVTKGIGYLQVVVDPDADDGMGEVKITQPEPFDLYIDPKSRDMLFRDAAFILCRKILPKRHLMNLFPDYVRKINKASSDEQNDYNYTEKSTGPMQKDFGYKDLNESEAVDPETGENDDFLELFELYEKVKVAYVNVFYQRTPDAEQLKSIQQKVKMQMADIERETQLKMKELDLEMQKQVETGEMLPERKQLEMEKQIKAHSEEIEQTRLSITSKLQQQAKDLDEKEFKVMMKNDEFSSRVIDQIKFFGERIRQTCCVGDQVLYEKLLPQRMTDYPIVPFHFKWTGTPFPISAVSPLIGKQRELNKAHQLMIHNAYLGSSLRWMHEEGSIDSDYWEDYSSAPGALLPIRPGSTAPTPVQPTPLSNAFFQVVQTGKQDMEYLAGIYSSMMGDTGKQHETYRGMLARDEYGTRRVKQWMKNSVEPGLKQLGKIVAQFSQTIYTTNKVFRLVQPSGGGSEEKQVEINVPQFNDYGQAIGKWKDFSSAKFDIRIVTGSTLPVNRWAYLAELKELMQLGVVDDLAVLAETDIRNKQNIAKRKSLYSQLQGQVSSMEQSLKDKEGTIETLERQLVQAGIKGKINQAEIEIAKKKSNINSLYDIEGNKTKAQQKLLRDSMAMEAKNSIKQNKEKSQEKSLDNNKKK